MGNAPLGCAESDQGRVGTYNTILQTLGTNSSSVQYDYEFNSSGSTSDSVTVGIGYSKGGSSGSFSQSGTTKLSSSITINYPARTTLGRRHYYTKTNYNKYFLVCSDFNGGYYTYYEIRPTSVTGDAWEGTLSSATYSYCTTLGAGITASRSTGRTVNYSNGIDVTVMGSDLKLTNELENGESHKVTFKNTSTTSKKICGQYTTVGDATKGTGILVGAA